MIDWFKYFRRGKREKRNRSIIVRRWRLLSLSLAIIIRREEKEWEVLETNVAKTTLSQEWLENKKISKSTYAITTTTLRITTEIANETKSRPSLSRLPLISRVLACAIADIDLFYYYFRQFSSLVLHIKQSHANLFWHLLGFLLFYVRAGECLSLHHFDLREGERNSLRSQRRVVCPLRSGKSEDTVPFQLVTAVFLWQKKKGTLSHAQIFFHCVFGRACAPTNLSIIRAIQSIDEEEKKVHRANHRRVFSTVLAINHDITRMRFQRRKKTQSASASDFLRKKKSFSNIGFYLLSTWQPRPFSKAKGTALKYFNRHNQY